jgi:hypothetical protein
MSMNEFDEVCGILIGRGYKQVSLSGPTRRTFVNDDAKVSIIIEFDDSQMTEKDEEIIKQRLIELGYL